MNRGIHIWSTVALAGAATACSVKLDGALLVAGGAWMGILLHPDLDLGDTPYALIRKHRGLSHWPLVGTLDRLLWFCGPLLLALAFSNVDWGMMALIGLGLALSDTLHSGLDVLDAVLVRRGLNL